MMSEVSEQAPQGLTPSMLNSEECTTDTSSRALPHTTEVGRAAGRSEPRRLQEPSRAGRNSSRRPSWRISERWETAGRCITVQSETKLVFSKRQLPGEACTGLVEIWGESRLPQLHHDRAFD